MLRPLKADTRIASWKSLPKGSGPSTARSLCASAFTVCKRSIAPKRRGSLNVTRAPFSMWNTTWSCFSAAGCSCTNLPSGSPETSIRPDIPRCTRSVSPELRSARMYFDRRRSRSTRCPVSRSAICSGNGQRRSGRFTSARVITTPSITGASPRRTVSTSGSSGIFAPAANGGLHLPT